MHPRQRHDRHRAAVAVVGGVVHVLIVQAEVRGLGQRQVVIGLENRLRPRMRQLAVADQDAGPAGVEVGFVSAWKCR